MIETTVLWSVLVACPKHGSLSSLTVVAYPTNGSLSIGGIPHKWEPVLIDGNPTGGGGIGAVGPCYDGVPHQVRPSVQLDPAMSITINKCTQSGRGRAGSTMQRRTFGDATQHA